MWSESYLRAAADFCAIVGFIGVVAKVLWYFTSGRPNETYRSFHTRMEFGEFRSPAIRARMERDPEFRARMEALLRSRVFRLKMAEVRSTAASLKASIEAAKPFVARVKAARTAKEAAVAAAAERGEGEECDEVAEASSRLLAVCKDEAGVLPRVTAMAAKHRAAKAGADAIILAVSLYPGRGPATRGGAAAGVRNRGRADVAAAGPVGQVVATGATGPAVAVEPMEIDSTASVEEGKPLL
eukprot:g11696.t1